MFREWKCKDKQRAQDTEGDSKHEESGIKAIAHVVV